MRLIMQRIFLILIGILLSGYCCSFAAEPQAAPESNNANISDNFVIDSNWIIVDLGDFVPRAINNSTQIAGDILSEKKGPFAGIWKQGFAEKLDGNVVTVRSSAIAINDSGQVVGYQKGRYGNNHEQAVLWNNGLMQELGTLGGIESRALAINNSGEIVGWVKTAFNVKDAFIWRLGTIEYLGILTSGIAINNNGQILGTIDGGDPVLWNKGIMQKLEPPGDQEVTPVGARQELNGKPTESNKSNNTTDATKPHKLRLNPTCLNDAGQASGFTNQNNAFLWSNGDIQYIDINEKERFIPFGMNKFGMLAGKINDKAVVWNKGTVTELNKYFKELRGWRSAAASGINDLGQIIVFASNGMQNASKAFLVTPKSNVPILIKGTKYAEVVLETNNARIKPSQQAPSKK